MLRPSITIRFVLLIISASFISALSIVDSSRNLTHSLRKRFNERFDEIDFLEERCDSIIADKKLLAVYPFPSKYEFTGTKLGKGGNGIVYEANNIITNQKVAIKIVGYPMNVIETPNCTYTKEVEIMKILHENGVNVPLYLECGSNGNEFYYIM